MTPITKARLMRITVLPFLVLVAAGAGIAQGPERVRAPASGIDQRIDIQLKEADVRETLASFGEILARGSEIGPEVAGEVSIELHDVRVATALTAVCESAGCLWWIEDGRLKVERDPEATRALKAVAGRAEGRSAERLEEPIDMELEDARLEETLRAFGSILQARVVIDETIEGTVTLELYDTPVRLALDTLCRVHGCTWELQETGEGPVLKFTGR